jgi:hypothetical protein
MILLFCIYLYKQFKMKKEKTECMIGFRISNKFKKSYMDFCDKNGYNFSKRIKFFMKNDMCKKIKIID